MKVFISWSGERSRHVAEALRAWIPRVIQSAKPWMSQEDISAGSRWLTEVSSVLDETQIGILCVTPENQHNPWLLFEAGALSKSLNQGRVCPLLFEITAGQLSGPLTQFQAHTLSKAGVLRVLNGLNGELGENRLPEGELEQILEVWWPQLEKQLSTIAPIATAVEARSTQEQLDELLTLAREHIRRENVRLEASKSKDERLDKMLKMMDESMSFMTTAEKSMMKMRGNVKDSFGAILQKIERDEMHPAEAVKEILKANLLTNERIPKVDFASMKELRALMTDFDAEHRHHIDQIINPPSGSDPSGQQA